MKIRQHEKIQNAVDQSRGSYITHLTDLHIAACGEVDDMSGWNAHSEGVKAGIALFQKYQKKVNTRPAISKKFGIYVAMQDTSDGLDHLYFIGTPKDIVEKINKVRDETR